TSSFNTGNWVDCWGTIVRVQSVITGNFDITNTGEFGRKLKFLFPTTQNIFNAAYFRIIPPGFSYLIGDLTNIYYLIPNGAVIPAGVTILEERKGHYVYNPRNDGATPAVPQRCSFVDSCIYVGYLTTSGTTTQDVVINTFEWDFGGFYADQSRVRGYVFKHNVFSLTETTSDNILVFDSINYQAGSKSLSFIGYRIVPNLADSGIPSYTTAAS
ncbi:MAG: hypothetical protein ACK5XN_38865, partial [Bacteroidota bacterium]